MNWYINSNLVLKLRKAVNILAEIKTVDGAGSGLDADLLDGQHGAYYQPADDDLTRLATNRRIGGDTHYTEFEADGTIVMTGDATVWDDSMVAPTSFRSGGTALTFDLLTATIYTHRFDVGDQIHVVCQLPHSIKAGSSIVPHLHIINKNAIGNTNYNVAFDIHYTWANIGSIFPSELNELNVKQSFQNIAALTHKMLSFTALAPTAVQGGISSIFMAKITRVAADAQNYATADIYSLGFDIHFEKDTLGSRQPTSK
jgi:hypothetical protein